jgi:CBS domain-containing protein
MAKLAEIMTSPVFTVPPQTPVAEAAAAMVRHGFGSAVVLQGSLLVGIVTERDVLRAAASRTDLTRTPVSQWMTSDPHTAAPDLDSEEATELMLGSGFRHLPVIDGDTLVGLVSLRDLLSTRIRRRLT